MLRSLIKTLLIAPLLMAVYFNSLAQQSTGIKGTVLDGQGDPVEGVTIIARQGTKEVGSAVTGKDGGFTLTRLQPAATYDLHFTHVNYASYVEKGVVVKEGLTTLLIRLTPKESNLNEVVVQVGYGSSRKHDLTGSVTSVPTNNLVNLPATRIDQMLQGRAAGVYVKSTNGAPGSPTTIRIRGTRSINATNEPIYVIDGIVDPSGAVLSSLNPEDIEGIDVLKDASTTAIYGSRASNGVVLITTKKGKAGKDVVHFSTNQGFSQLARTLDMMNAREFVNFENEARGSVLNNYAPPLYKNVDSILQTVGGDKGNNWIDDVTRNAPFSSYDVSISGGEGGDHGYSYYLSGNYLNQQGIILNTDFKRYQGRLNFTKKISAKADFGVTLNVTHSNTNAASINFGSNSNWLSSFVFLPPTMPVRKPDGTYATFNPDWYLGGGNIDNPVAILDKETNVTPANNVLGNFYIQYEVAPGLKLKSTLGINFINSRNSWYVPSDMPTKILNNQMTGNTSSTQNNTSSLINENTVTYSKNFGVHHLELLAGESYQTKKVDGLSGSGSGITNDITQWNNLGVIDQALRGISSDYNENTIISYLGRVNYDYQKRYYLTFTARRDGASNFAADKKWGFFPSGAFKWRVSNESFFKDSKVNNILSDMSFRVSYGLSGNQGIGNYASLASLTANSSAYLFGQTPVLGYTQGNIANNDLTWETTAQLDAGLDFELFNGRLNFTADYYRMNSKNLLVTVQIPSQTGYGSRLVNLGKSLTDGFDFSLSGDVIRSRNFKWNVIVNVSTNHQKVTDIGPLTKVLLDPGIGYGVTSSYMEKGVPLGANYGLDYAGVWKSQAEITAEQALPAGKRNFVSASNQYLPGHPKYVDPNHDGVLNVNDYHYLAPANPTVFGGFGSTLTYKRVTLDFFFQFNMGNKMYNAMEFFAGTGTYLTNQFRYILNRWTPTNPNSNIPAVESRDNIASTRLLHDASLLRLKSLMLSYNLKGLLPKKVFKDMQVFVSGTNLFLLTKYNGFDPEVNSGGQSSTVIAVDNGNYPNSRTVTCGLNFSL
ncbi:MAG: TonB-dependent receptor [Bacteroidetes bacterium]|nr:TonB-dependent receptor [Bacteroidota bacterium]